MANKFGREQAWQLLTEWTQSESLRKHALGVESCVTACGETEADRLGLEGEARGALKHHVCVTFEEANHNCQVKK